MERYINLFHLSDFAFAIVKIGEDRTKSEVPNRHFKGLFTSSKHTPYSRNARKRRRRLATDQPIYNPSLGLAAGYVTKRQYRRWVALGKTVHLVRPASLGLVDSSNQGRWDRAAGNWGHLFHELHLLPGLGDLVTVGIVDSGINPALAGLRQGALVGFKDYISGKEGVDYAKDHHPDGHGSQMAQIIGGGGGLGGAPFCSLVSSAVINEDDCSDLGDIYRGIIYCLEHRARVINMSLRPTVSSNSAWLERGDQWTDLIGSTKDLSGAATDALFVIAAGNSGEKTYNPLAASRDGLSIGAIQPDGRRHPVSSSCTLDNGRGIPDAYAAGSNFGVITNPDMQFVGTSIAAAHVSAAAARLLSENLGQTAEEIRDRILGALDAGPYPAFKASLIC